MQKKVEKEGLLLETILELFSEQSHKKLKSYLKNNSIFVNGKCITAYNYKVRKNDIIEIRKDYKTHKKCPLKILFEDEYFLVIDKPTHLLTIATTKEKENYSQVKVNIKTGRKNQIRAVLSYLGYPIIGDVKYGSAIKAK